jgi:hypothetical protein
MHLNSMKTMDCREYGLGSKNIHGDSYCRSWRKHPACCSCGRRKWRSKVRERLKYDAATRPSFTTSYRHTLQLIFWAVARDSTRNFTARATQKSEYFSLLCLTSQVIIDHLQSNNLLARLKSRDGYSNDQL